MSSKEDSLDSLDATCEFESFSKVYRVKISNYSQIKQFTTEGTQLKIGTFNLAGHFWAILFNPNSILVKQPNTYTYTSERIWYISFGGNLLTETSAPLNVEYEFTLVDQSGKSWASPKMYETVKQKGNGFRIDYFMKKTEFESSEFLKNDCFTLQCALRVVKPLCINETRKQVIIPSSDLHRHFEILLEREDGTDVTFDVNEERFVAHKAVLAARSLVFKAQFFGSMMENKSNRVKIKDVKPEIFKLMLHFIYTDMLPHEVEISHEMGQHLLVVADRYGLERLKLISAEILCESLSVENAATTLILAEQHNCRQLKEVCVDFVSSREVLDDVMVSEGFGHLIESCPLLLKELLKKFDKRRKI